MLALNYRLEPIAAAKAKEIDRHQRTSRRFVIICSPGTSSFRRREWTSALGGGWVQILDFALSLEAIGATLEREREIRFELTESNAALSFRFEGDTVLRHCVLCARSPANSGPGVS